MTDSKEATLTDELTGPKPAGESVAAIEIRNLHKTFRRVGGAEVFAIDDVSLSVAPSEIVVLLGPSGCGKTTLLRCVGGFERPDSGSISIAGRPVFSSEPRTFVPPERRPVGMIFQSYALWPHMTVFDNVAYPLRCRKLAKSEVLERTSDILRSVGLDGLGNQHPGRLSGGQQQRVALARALVAGEKVLLFDEPLSNVDAKVRERLRVELLGMQAEFGFAALYVTHDQQEAMELADRVAVLNNGRVLQLGSPKEIYQRPATEFVANFVGKINELRGAVVNVAAGSADVKTDLGIVTCTIDDVVSVGAEVIVGWRPEQTIVHVDPPEGLKAWPGRVVAELFAGTHFEYVIDLGVMSCRVLLKNPIDLHADVSVEVAAGVARAMPHDMSEPV
ncbi:MAG: ABC transporter ATP-binding protein [Actinomycetota bacterium]